MKNCFRTIVVFAIIGLALNLILCATIAIRSNMSLSKNDWRTSLSLGRTEINPGESWLFWRLDKPGLTALSFTPPAYPVLHPRRYDEKGYDFRPDLLPDFARIKDYPRPSPVPIHGLFCEAVGWPMLALATSELRSKAIIDVESGLVMHSKGVRRLIPLRPIWTGLMLNTLLFGGSLWCVLTVLSYIRYRKELGNTIPATYSFADARRGVIDEPWETPERKRAA